MAEYIDRNVIEYPYVNTGAWAINNEVCKAYDAGVKAMEDKIKAIPAADVEEVVRCKDCNQWKRNSGFVDSPNGHCFYHGIDTNGHDFCSYGAKMDRKGEGDV